MAIRVEAPLATASAHPSTVPRGGKPISSTATVSAVMPTSSMPNNATAGPALRPVNRAMKSAPPQPSALATPQSAAFIARSPAPRATGARRSGRTCLPPIALAATGST